MDTLAALALATEAPKPELLKRPPYRKNEYIISQRMVKHILGQTFVQMGVLFAFVFGAQVFLPEFWPAGVTPDWTKKVTDVFKYDTSGPANTILTKTYTWNGQTILQHVANSYWSSGVMVPYKSILNHENAKYRDWNGQFVLSGMKQDLNGLPGYDKKMLSYSKSRHLTAVFNLFVWFQIFNMICCRKINDELNVFAHIFENVYFGVVWIMICVLQVLLI